MFESQLSETVLQGKILCVVEKNIIESMSEDLSGSLDGPHESCTVQLLYNV